jgi:hypothetical protein
VTWEIQAIVPVPLLIEYESVLTRPHQLAATVCRSRKRTRAGCFGGQGWQIRPDEMVLETAVNGQTDRLVTFNLRHFSSAAKAFGIHAVTPPEAWKEVQHRNEEK